MVVKCNAWQVEKMAETGTCPASDPGLRNTSDTGVQGTSPKTNPKPDHSPRIARLNADNSEMPGAIGKDAPDRMHWIRGIRAIRGE
jgi:hypothetical protein